MNTWEHKNKGCSKPVKQQVSNILNCYYTPRVFFTSSPIWPLWKYGLFSKLKISIAYSFHRICKSLVTISNILDIVMRRRWTELQNYTQHTPFYIWSINGRFYHLTTILYWQPRARFLQIFGLRWLILLTGFFTVSVSKVKTVQNLKHYSWI